MKTKLKIFLSLTLAVFDAFVATAQTSQPEMICSFTSTNGMNPLSHLAEGPDSNFYGTTPFGGTNNGNGTVFKVTTNGVLTSLVSFNSTNGAYPIAGLTLGSDGNFYGTTSEGGTNRESQGGTVFKVTTNGGLTSLVSLHDSAGILPNGELTLGNDGNFYGTTRSGTSLHYGAVFKVTTDGTLTGLVSFNIANGANPSAGLTQGSDGNFYGTTTFGGTNSGNGTVFKVTTNGVLTSLVSFNSSNGANPYGRLTMGNDSNFYGTTYGGGTNGGWGTVFKVTTNGVLTSMVSFNSNNGAYPLAGLTLGSDGNFYGTTQKGGNGYGTIFKVTTNGVLTTLAAFANTNGASPQGQLTLRNDGTLYGTTRFGGVGGFGVIFRFIIPGNPPTILVQPASLTNVFTTPAAFSVSATGDLPLSYHWLKDGGSLTDGGNVSGSGTTNLSLAAVSSTDAAGYSVVVTNNSGSVTSSVATLTFLKAVPVITWPAPSPITYGTALNSVQLNAGANVPGSFTYSPQAGMVLNAGTNSSTAMFTPTDTLDYSSVTSSVSLIVSPAPLSVTASSASRSYGQNNPLFGGSLTGVTNNDNITAGYNCSAIPISPPGTYPIVPILADPSSRLGNYSVTASNGTLTVTAGPPPMFAGIAPTRGVTNGGTAVTITGSGFELGATVSFGSQSAASVVVNSGTQITAVTPPNPLGVVNVVMTNPDSTSAALINGFTYTRPPPVIIQVSNHAIAVGQTLTITNVAQASTPPVTFSLASSAPAGAVISTNGIFRWTPVCSQGSTTNLITIWATDSDPLALSNSMTFVVTVSECVQVGIGSTVLQVGQTGGVAVTLLSTVGLTNLSWTLAAPFNRFTNWSFAASNASISTTIVQPVSASQTFFNLNTTAGQTLQSPSLLGTIFFKALPGSSGFLPIVATNILGTKLDGSVVGNIVGQPGRVVVIGPEPLLEALISSNSTRMLTLYGNPGTNYQVLFNTNLLSTNWQNGTNVTLTNLFELIPADQTAPQIYYRAR